MGGGRVPEVRRTTSGPGIGVVVPQSGTYPATTTDVLTAKVTGDAANRFVINADGKIEWGNGTDALDTNLYRSAADTLKTDDALVVQSPTATAVPLIVKGAASQSGGLQEWQNSAGTALAYIGSDGGIVTGASVMPRFVQAAAGTGTYFDFDGATINAFQRAAGTTAFVVRGASGQTTTLQDWQSDGGTVLLSVTAAGLLRWVAAGNQQTTVGAAGGASALPLTPTKYLKVVDSAGTTLVIPAYAAA